MGARERFGVSRVGVNKEGALRFRAYNPFGPLSSLSAERKAVAKQHMVRGLRRALEDLLAFHLDKKNEGLWVYNMLLEADNLIDLEYVCAQVEVRLNYVS